jgi:hypothetical protein
MEQATLRSAAAKRHQRQQKNYGWSRPSANGATVGVVGRGGGAKGKKKSWRRHARCKGCLSRFGEIPPSSTHTQDGRMGIVCLDGSAEIPKAGGDLLDYKIRYLQCELLFGIFLYF